MLLDSHFKIKLPNIKTSKKIDSIQHFSFDLIYLNRLLSIVYTLKTCYFLVFNKSNI